MSPLPQTLFDKLWQRHVVHESPDGPSLLYVDRHLVYEVTSPQAFEGWRLAGRKPWRRETVLATAHHNVPTTGRERGITETTGPSDGPPFLLFAHAGLVCAVAAFAMPANYAGVGLHRLPRHVRQGIVVLGWFRLVRLRE